MNEIDTPLLFVVPLLSLRSRGICVCLLVFLFVCFCVVLFLFLFCFVLLFFFKYNEWNGNLSDLLEGCPIWKRFRGLTCISKYGIAK